MWEGWNGYHQGQSLGVHGELIFKPLWEADKARDGKSARCDGSGKRVNQGY
jgi:hypothetical protein